MGLGDWISTFIIRIERPEDAARVAETVDSLFRNSTAQTKTETEKQFELSFLAFLGNVKLFLLSVCDTRAGQDQRQHRPGDPRRRWARGRR